MLPKTDPVKFWDAVHAVRAVNNMFATNVHQYALREYERMRCYLWYGGLAGFAIQPDGELVNVFNHTPMLGLGELLVLKAIAEGASHLDCFDGYLVNFYRALGFVEYKREANWVPREPDVVYMRLVR